MSSASKGRVHSAEDTDMLPEYDFEKMHLQQGRTYRVLQEGRNRRLLAPELAPEFPSDHSVNGALRQYLNGIRNVPARGDR